ncbi:ankyrin repeat domain-containing protein [Candidatus Tisiphia endosymbiont of Oplodontha viridula]|uniref:ankyrin repeat domain-containing protein n=1 Tax=Candidatus Tisiphia endosymbiont of Oplodontha viridula TaxID=3077925 RepID=UPI0035C8EAAE
MYFNRDLGSESRSFIILKLLARLSYKKFLVVFLITIFLFMDRAYSAPPPLPPALPQLENDKVNKHKETSEETDSLMKEIQQFMPSKKTDDQVLEPIKPVSTPQGISKEESETDSFIDLGNNKLPILENTLDHKKINNPKELEQLDKIPSQKIEPKESSKNNNGIDNNSSTLPPTEKQNTESQDTVPLKPIDVPILPKPQIAREQIDNKAKPEVTEPNVSPVTMLDKEKNSVESQQVDNEDKKGVITPNLDIVPSSQEKKPTESQETPPIIPAVLPKENTEPKATKPDIIPIIPKDSPVSATPQTQTPVPVFVKDDKQPEQSSNVVEEKDNNVVKEERKVNKKQPNKVTPITQNVASTIKEMSPEIALFIEDEKQMLFLPDDDIVLGELTEEARLNQMAMYAFIQMFKTIYDSESRENQRKIIDRFIDNYTSNMHITSSIVNGATDRAFEAVRKNNLFALRALLDNYLIIQKRGNDNYTLLHEAAETGNYYMAKFLIMRGINIKATDYHYRTALEISDEQNNNVSCLIRKAIAN